MSTDDRAAEAQQPAWGTRAVHAAQEAADPATKRAGGADLRHHLATSSTARARRQPVRAAEFGNIYTRIMNPTTDAFERRIADLEGGVAAVATASGQAAQTLALLNLAQAGDYDRGLLGAVRRHLHAAALHAEALRHHHALRGRQRPGRLRGRDRRATRAVYLETIGNPKLDVPDFRGSPTWRTPPACRWWWTTPSPRRCWPPPSSTAPTSWCTPRPSGSAATAPASAAWWWTAAPSTGAAPERFRELYYQDPEPAYHGLSFADVFGDFGGANIAYAIRLRVLLLRDIGAALSPFNSFLFLQGLETLHLRIQRHSENALAVARFLEGTRRSPGSATPAWSRTPRTSGEALPGGGFGGVLTFGVLGGEEAAKRVIEETRLFSLVANVGDAKSLIIHPWSTTHEQLGEAEREAAGVSPPT
jgi:O-acetylhomoserine (thiol)-lyase